jgi:hypothetical protein
MIKAVSTCLEAKDVNFLCVCLCKPYQGVHDVKGVAQSSVTRPSALAWRPRVSSARAATSWVGGWVCLGGGVEGSVGWRWGGVWGGGWFCWGGWVGLGLGGGVSTRPSALACRPRMSSPRAATSVASKNATSPFLNFSSDCRRAACVMSPCSSAAAGSSHSPNSILSLCAPCLVLHML